MPWPMVIISLWWTTPGPCFSVNPAAEEGEPPFDTGRRGQPLASGHIRASTRLLRPGYSRERLYRDTKIYTLFHPSSLVDEESSTIQYNGVKCLTVLDPFLTGSSATKGLQCKCALRDCWFSRTGCPRLGWFVCSREPSDNNAKRACVLKAH